MNDSCALAAHSIAEVSDESRCLPVGAPGSTAEDVLERDVELILVHERLEKPPHIDLPIDRNPQHRRSTETRQRPEPQTADGRQMRQKCCRDSSAWEP